MNQQHTVKPRLDHFGDELSIYQNCFDLRDGVRENKERKIPAPDFDELEPEAMSMCVCVWWRWWQWCFPSPTLTLDR
jgi:hypothetical protein